MTDVRLLDYLDHMLQAATDARSFIGNSSREEFKRDRRTQQAVTMNLIILGEAATKLMDRYPEFVERHPQIPWHNMRGMRNRMAHGYFDIDLDIVWETVRNALPSLLEELPAVRESAG